MLSIRTPQIQAFQGEIRSRFLEKLDAFVLEEFSESASMPKEERMGILDALVTVAAGYDLEFEHHVSQYVAAAWLCGWTFDQDNAEVGERLECEDYTPDEKIEWLRAWAEKQAEGY